MSLPDLLVITVVVFAMGYVLGAAQGLCAVRAARRADREGAR